MVASACVPVKCGWAHVHTCIREREGARFADACPWVLGRGRAGVHAHAAPGCCSGKEEGGREDLLRDAHCGALDPCTSNRTQLRCRWIRVLAAELNIIASMRGMHTDALYHWLTA